MKIKPILTLFIIFTLLESKSQCAMCRAVLESEESSNAAQGINDGILFLMTIPYLLVFTIGYVIYRTYKNTKKVEN